MSTEEELKITFICTKNIFIIFVVSHKLAPGGFGQLSSITISRSAFAFLMLHLMDTLVHKSGSSTSWTLVPSGMVVWLKAQHFDVNKDGIQLNFLLGFSTHLNL